MKNILILLFLISTIINLQSCSNQKNSEQASEVVSTDMQISKEQFLASQMEVGNPVKASFENLVKINGMIVASPTGKAVVSSYIPGIINSIAFSTGDYVQKGKILCSINSSEAISIQQEYAETAGKLKKLSSDFKRMKSLMDEKIGAQKDYIAIESEYLGMKARHEGLLRHLELIGLNPDEILNGKFTSVINIQAPISGFITILNCITGQYVEPQKVLFEIVDQNQLELKLSVFAKDISILKKGQVVRFYNLSDRSLSGLAELYSIGKSIDPETKAVICMAKIKNKELLVPIDGESVETEIVTSFSETLALPSEAIQKSTDGTYVYIKTREENGMIFFAKKKVSIGASNNEYTEIKGDTTIENVLIKGTYNLQSE